MKTTLSLLALLLLLPSNTASAAEPPYFELRIYDITTNKLAAVLERFRDAVEPIRQKHGIKTMGYWTASTTNATHLIYLMKGRDPISFQQADKAFGADPAFQAAYKASSEKHGKTVDRIISLPLSAGDSELDLSASPIPRTFELRLYSLLPGKLDTFRNRWREHAVPIDERHGLHSLGWWVATQKDPRNPEIFVCLLAGDSRAGIEKSIADFHRDPEWQQVQKETEREGSLRSDVTAYKLTPTDFSLLK